MFSFYITIIRLEFLKITFSEQLFTLRFKFSFIIFLCVQFCCLLTTYSLSTYTYFKMKNKFKRAYYSLEEAIIELVDVPGSKL